VAAAGMAKRNSLRVIEAVVDIRFSFGLLGKRESTGQQQQAREIKATDCGTRIALK
jgi:hypothetical protein